MTPEHVSQLTAPFYVNEHEFLRGKIYITEAAITRRLDDVDPGWSFAVRSIEHRGEKTTVYAAMTVAGVTRESNGTAESNYVKDKERTPENEVNEREKSALTDALKRCARLFGIGRYMLDMGDAVRDWASLEAWMNANMPSNPFEHPSTQKAIRAVVTAHGLHLNGGVAFLLAKLSPDQDNPATRFGDLHPALTPDDVIVRIADAAKAYHAIKQPKGKAS